MAAICRKPGQPYFDDTVFFEEDNVIMRWRQDHRERFYPNISEGYSGSPLYHLPKNWFFG